MTIPWHFRGDQGSVRPSLTALKSGKIGLKKRKLKAYENKRGELLTSSVQTVCGNVSLPVRSRQVTDPIQQLDAGSFISLTRQIKKRERRRKVGRWGGVKHQHPQLKALLAQGHGTETPWNTGNQGNGSKFTPRAEPGLGHRVGRRDGAGTKPSESGTSLISRGFGSGSDAKSKEGFVL